MHIENPQKTKGISFKGMAVSSNQRKTLKEALEKGKKKECVINFILLVSSEMLCLYSFHGDRGVLWWLIDTQGAIHLYTGCVRGRAAGTSAPTNQPLMQIYRKCFCSTSWARFRSHWLKVSLRLHIFSVGWSVFKNLSVWTKCLNSSDTEITSFCAAECLNEFSTRTAAVIWRA